MKNFTTILLIAVIIALTVMTIGSSTIEIPSYALETAKLKATIENQKKIIHEQQDMMEELIKTFMHIPKPPNRAKLMRELETREMIARTSK